MDSGETYLQTVRAYYAALAGQEATTKILAEFHREVFSSSLRIRVELFMDRPWFQESRDQFMEPDSTGPRSRVGQLGGRFEERVLPDRRKAEAVWCIKCSGDTYYFALSDIAKFVFLDPAPEPEPFPA